MFRDALGKLDQPRPLDLDPMEAVTDAVKINVRSDRNAINVIDAKERTMNRICVRVVQRAAARAYLAGICPQG